MSITIMSNLWEEQSSVLKLYDNPIKLITKRAIYDNVFGINSDGLPDIIIMHNRESPFYCSQQDIDRIDSINPDIYVSYTNDAAINRIKSKPKLLILFDVSNKKITCNGTTIDVKFSDAGVTGNRISINGITKVYVNIAEMEYIFNLDVYWPYFEPDYSREYFTKINPFIKMAFINVTKRLIIEFIMQYRDNPTTDKKAELLEIADNLQNQLNALRLRIDNM